MPRAKLKTAGKVLVALCLLLFASSACRQQPQPNTPTDSLKILIRGSGLYRLNAASLQDIGFPLTALQNGMVQLTERGRDVPLYLDNEDGLIFYGQASTSRYTPFRAYILRADHRGIEMSEENAAPPAPVSLSTVTRIAHLEQNLDYLSDAQVREATGPWFWQTIGMQDAEPIEFTLRHVTDGAGQLTVNLYGTTHNPAADPDHSLSLVLNAAEQAHLSWEGQSSYTATVDLPAGSLSAGSNTIQLRNIPEDYLDISRLNWLELQYDSFPVVDNDYLQFTSNSGTLSLEGFSQQPLLVDVTYPINPVLLSGWDYASGLATVHLARDGAYVAAAGDGFLTPAEIKPLRQGTWSDTNRQADLLIVTTDVLASALQPLVAARTEQGLEVSLVPIEEIYDTFGHGAATPDSINQFVTFAFENWQPPVPRYLLLVGDATTDFWGYLATRPEDPVSPPENVIPPYLVPVNFSGETVSDARLADVDGDYLPELAVGRWPVDSVTQLRDLVQRTLAYENEPATPHAIFTADGSSDEFRLVTEQIIAASSFPEANSEILLGPAPAELAGSWQEGAWLVTYTGHGSLQLWGKEGILTAAAANSLRSTGAPPVVLQLTCLTGLFSHPEIKSLSEIMLTQPRGPVLIIGATSLTLSTHQEPFAASLLQALQNPSFERIGDALLHAKRSLDVSSVGLREISDTFGLLGDPSALVVRPRLQQ